MVGLLGPTFPDLRLIAQEDLETASWIFTTGSIGKYQILPYYILYLPVVLASFVTPSFK